MFVSTTQQANLEPSVTAYPWEGCRKTTAFDAVFGDLTSTGHGSVPEPAEPPEPPGSRGYVLLTSELPEPPLGRFALGWSWHVC